MTFVASNGIKLSTTNTVRWYNSGNDGDLNYDRGTNVDEALAEWYRAREDENLGRVRLPEHPRYVIYPLKDAAKVLDEVSGVSWVWYNEENLPDFEDEDGAHVALAYFNSFIEPGDHWKIEYEGELYISQMNKNHEFWLVMDNGLGAHVHRSLVTLIEKVTV